MATENRQSTPDLTRQSDLLKKIQREPWRYDFFQLVRLLEHYQPVPEARSSGSTLSEAHSKGAGKEQQAPAPVETTDHTLSTDQANAQTLAPIGKYYPPRKEPLRFSMNPSLAFEGASVHKLTVGGEGRLAHAEQWELEVNFWGMVGSKGVLPFHYRELVLQRLRKKDASMKHFFDLLDHRSLSLFYRAWKKYRVAIAFEENQRLDPKYNRDRYGEMIKGLLGLSSKTDANFYQARGAEFNCAGLISRRVCSPLALSQAIKQQFGLEVDILPFRGQWQTMPEDIRTRSGNRLGRNHVLGLQAILGEKTWAIQNRFTVQFKDIDYDKFIRLVSGTDMLTSMYSLIRTMAGVALDFDLSLEVQQRKLPATRLADQQTPPLLGWNSKVHGDYPPHHYIKVAVSRHAMQRTLNKKLTAEALL